MLRRSINKQFNYYPLIASFILGVVGGYSSIVSINHHQENQTHKRLAYLPTVAKTNKATKTIDATKAYNLVWNLPQVQRKAREIENLSKGSIRVAAVVDSSPTVNASFYVVRVFENHPDKITHPVYWFRVSSSGNVIEPLDLVENEYIALEKWNPDGR
ncbi:hypothetical protein [Anabaena catenula]|uniref:Uncharacterized protein n=1 Tax=Anabaena catenula FACHB-362 TaxID=2692877 RepID=A0ABR8IXV8_9NOST|nr:hypothetical protein [Anabaena catenula]MBD2690846.1 hypothetical protein [Anabaena catenula FACHB-362]